VIIVWKKVLALLFGLLILGLTVSGASATASFVNGTANVTQTALLGATPEKRPGDEVQPQFGGVTVVAEPFISAFIPGIGWIVAIGSVLALIAKYVYSKPVSEFTEAFVSEIPDKITYNGQKLAKGVKTNIWGSEAEIGYGYVKKEWFGLKKEAVIVKPIIKINRDEVTAVEDLFSPKEYGKLLAQAYLNGWDANDAKKLAEDFDREYRNFHAFYSGGYHPSCEAGPVIIKQYGARHIIKRHITQEIPGGTPWEVNSARELLDIIKQVIENPDIEECKPWKDTHRAVLHKNINGKWYTVVIERVRYWWEVVTAFPRDMLPV